MTRVVWSSRGSGADFAEKLQRQGVFKQLLRSIIGGTPLPR